MSILEIFYRTMHYFHDHREDFFGQHRHRLQYRELDKTIGWKFQVFFLNIVSINWKYLSLHLIHFYISFLILLWVIRAMSIALILYSRRQTCFSVWSSNSLKELDSKRLVTPVLTYRSHYIWEMIADPYLHTIVLK